jgi:anti-sigma regulatory factor (Ser/Thr protein kinase)
MVRGARRSVAKLPGDRSAVPAARQFASQAMDRVHPDDELVDKTRLLVTELTTNAVVHAHSPIRLSVTPTAHGVRVEVRDDDPTPLAPPCLPDPEAEHGRGLWLVAMLASSWGINRNEHGKTVWFEVH